LLAKRRGGALVAWGRAAALTALESRFDCSFGNGAATACNPKEA